MSYSNGTFTIAASGNPVVTGTAISSTWANNTLSELATALTSRGTSIATGLSGAGTTQGTATSVSSVINVFSTVTSGSGAVLSSTATADSQTALQIIYNGGASPLKVYPPTSSAINGLPVNTPMILAIKTVCVFYFVSSTQWIAVLSA